MALAARKIYPTPAHEVADRLLAEIAELNRALTEIKEGYEREIAEIKARYYPRLEETKARLKRAEQELKKLGRRERLALFAAGDRCDLPNGALILTLVRRVKRARGVLAKLEELGWEEAIVVSKKVNWEVLERWPDEKLIACGTERIVKEDIEYELKGVE